MTRPDGFNERRRTPTSTERWPHMPPGLGVETADKCATPQLLYQQDEAIVIGDGRGGHAIRAVYWGCLRRLVIPLLGTTHHVDVGEVRWFSFGCGRDCDRFRCITKAMGLEATALPSRTEGIPACRERV